MTIAFIVPCYNESKRMNFQGFKDWESSHEEVTFFFVNDGSTDDTLKNLKNYFQESQVIDLGQNYGKAEAVRMGMNIVHKEGKYNFIGFLDADLATPLSQLPLFIEQTKQQKKIIIGSRILRLGGDIKRKWYRHYLGRIFATAASTLLNLPVYDTQCGAKLFDSQTLKNTLDDPFISKWIFDVELFFRMKKQKSLTVGDYIEIPLTYWEDVGGTRLKVTDFLKAPFELLQLYRRYC